MRPPELHDVHETAKRVRKSVSWLYQEGAKGTIPRTKIGRNVSWTDEQIAQIIRDGAQDPQPQATTPAPRKREAAPAPQRKAAKRQPSPPHTANNIPKANFGARTRYADAGHP